MRTQLLVIVSLVSLPAAAWEVRTDSEGDLVQWNQSLALFLDSQAEAQLNAIGATEAIRSAVRHLDEATPYLEVTVQVGAAMPVGYTVGGKNQNSILVLEDWPYSPTALAATIVTLNARTNEVLDADVAFNASAHRFRVLPAATARNEREFNDVQNTITHELGHALGLMHDTASEDLVMYPSAPPGEIIKRTLKTDDRDGLLSLYGLAPEPAPQPALVGCSATSTPPGALMLAVIVFALLRGAKRKSASWAVLALVPALAGAAEPIPVEVARAESVALVEVTARQSRLHPRNPGLIITELSFVTRECLKGTCGELTSVIVGGGRIGDLEQVVVHEPVAAPGERLLITRTAGQVRVLHLGPAARKAVVNALRPTVQPVEPAVSIW